MVKSINFKHVYLGISEDLNIKSWYLELTSMVMRNRKASPGMLEPDWYSQLGHMFLLNIMSENSNTDNGPLRL